MLPMIIESPWRWHQLRQALIRKPTDSSILRIWKKKQKHCIILVLLIIKQSAKTLQTLHISIMHTFSPLLLMKRHGAFWKLMRPNNKVHNGQGNNAKTKKGEGIINQDHADHLYWMIMHKEFVSNGQSVTQHYYLEVLKQLNQKIRHKQCVMWTPGQPLISSPWQHATHTHH